MDTQNQLLRQGLNQLLHEIVAAHMKFALKQTMIETRGKEMLKTNNFFLFDYRPDKKRLAASYHSG